MLRDLLKIQCRTSDVRHGINGVPAAMRDISRWDKNKTRRAPMYLACKELTQTNHSNELGDSELCERWGLVPGSQNLSKTQDTTAGSLLWKPPSSDAINNNDNSILAGALRQRRVWYARPVPVALGANRVVRVEYHQEARAVPLMARMAMPQPVYTPGPGYYPNPGQ